MIKSMFVTSTSLRACASKQRGQGMSEYIIIITALVAVAGIGLFAAFGDSLSNYNQQTNAAQ